MDNSSKSSNFNQEEIESILNRLKAEGFSPEVGKKISAILKSSSLEVEFKVFWSEYIAEMVAQQQSWQLCASPWKITAIGKDGEIDELISDRIDYILKKSKWEKINKIIVNNMSLFGAAFISVTRILTDDMTFIPVINVASSASQYVETVGSDLIFAQLIQYFSNGTRPLIYTSTYSPTTIINGEFRTEGEGQNQSTYLDADQVPSFSGYVIPVKQKGYGFVPVVRFINKLDGKPNAGIYGFPDVNSVVQELAHRCDVIWDKILDYMISNTNIVATVRSQQNLNNVPMAINDKQVTTRKLARTFREIQVNSKYQNGDPYQIIPGRFDVGPLWDTFMEHMMIIGYMTGGVPLVDRFGSYQITDAQRYSSAKNTGELIMGQKIGYIKTAIKQMLEMIVKIDEGFDYGNLKDWVIDINMTEAGVDYEMAKNPAPFIKSGWSPLDIIKRTRKMGHREAVAKLDEIERLKQRYPDYYKMVFGEETETTENTDKRQKAVVEPKSGDLLGVEE